MNQLAHLFQLIAQQEVTAHSLKCLDAQAVFNMMVGTKETMSVGDLDKYLRDHNVNASIGEIHYIFHQIDRDNDSQISFKEYSIQLYSFSGYLQKSTSKSKDINKLLYHELITAKILFKQMPKDLNHAQIFKTISYKGQITQQMLNDILIRHYVKLTQQELQLLFAYLDRKKDGVITFSEFQEFFIAAQNQQNVIVLKQNQEVRLVNALYELMNINKQIEQQRVTLFEQDDFNTHNAFRQFDTFHAMKITRLDFDLACMDLQIKTNKQQVSLFFQRYSDDGSFLTYENFLAAIQPKLDPIIRDPIVRISKKTLTMFKNLIKAMLDTEEQIEVVKEKLCYNSEFSVDLAFQFMDKLQIGSITIDEFREVFESHNIQISNVEIEQLISMYNKNSDYKVTYNSFIKAMSPHKQ